MSERAERVGHAVSELLPTVGRIAALHRVQVGWGNENWIADTELGRVMVKVGLADASVAKWRCAGEALGLARNSGVPAPELLAFEDSSPLLSGRVLRVFSYIAGQPPHMIVGDDAKRERFLGQLGAAVARLHGITLPRFSSRIGDANGFSRWSEYIANRWPAVVERAESARVDPGLVSAAEAMLLPLSTRFDAVTHPVLCHRDLYVDNLLCDRDGNLVAILDFDTAEAWEPAADFHKLRWWVFGDDAAAERAFLSAYTAGAPLPEDFDERVLLVEIIELVNGLANWLLRGADEIGVAAEARLRAFLGA